MERIEDEDLKIDPELAAVWNSDEEPDFAALRASLPAEEEVTTVDEPEVIEEPVEQEEEVVEYTDETDNNELEQPAEEILEDSTEIIENTDDVTDEDSEEVEEPGEEQPEAVDEPVVDSTYKIKANGMEFEFTIDELQKLAPKAMDYTKKMQEIAPYRKTISALKENGLGENEVNLMIDVLKGDKAAIAEVLKRTGVDALDVEPNDAEFRPNDYGKPDHVLDIEEIVSEISVDPEYKITEQVIDRQWDSASRNMMAQNPQMIKGLHDDIKTGIYDKIAPMALKMKAMSDGTKSDLEYYIEAASQYNASLEPVETLPQQAHERTIRTVVPNETRERQQAIKTMAPRRKAAAPTKAGSGKKDVMDYLDENDEAFEDWYKQLMSKS